MSEEKQRPEGYRGYQPQNGLSFTIHCLQELGKLMDSEPGLAAKMFCDYDRVAVKDAIYYLEENAALRNEATAAINYVHDVRQAAQALHSVITGRPQTLYNEARGIRIGLEMGEQDVREAVRGLVENAKAR